MDNTKIWLSSPHIGKEELENVNEVFATNWVAPVGPFLSQFEEQLSEKINRKSVVAVQSGTAAIHLALRLLDVQKDDIVLCQSFTFIGSANPILYQNATPVFIDSEEETWNICPQALETAIKKYNLQNKIPKAIVVVHLYGMPAKMDEILLLSNKYDIPIIEDAAEALGSSINGVPCGSFGEFSILSFNGNKIITTSGGGALASNDTEVINKARFLSTQAKDDAPHYEHSVVGYNYRLSNVSAAIGVGQLSVLEDRVMGRRAMFSFYKSLFKEIDGIELLEEPKGFYSNRWLSCVLVDKNKTKLSTNQLRLALESQNIESRPLWKPMHKQPVFKDAPYFGGTICETLFKKGLCLPSGSNLRTEDRERIQNAILTALK